MSFPHRLAPHWRHRFVCHVCWEAASGLLLHCHDCQMDVHVACCASADTSLSDTTHVSHPQHPLSLLHVIRHVDHQCDGCGATSGDGADLIFYSCRPCAFDLCGLCVRAPISITHPGHPHLLALGTPPPPFSNSKYIMYIHTYIHTYIHPYMHASIHPSIHTYIHTCVSIINGKYILWCAYNIYANRFLSPPPNLQAYPATSSHHL